MVQDTTHRSYATMSFFISQPAQLSGKSQLAGEMQQFNAKWVVFFCRFEMWICYSDCRKFLLNSFLRILLAKDMLRLIGKKNERFDLKDYLRPAFCIPETAHLDRLLREFKEKQSHMAVVVDEYGGIAGLVTLEDALEQIVGDIHDEHDDANEDSHWISPHEDGTYTVQAITPITEFNDYFEATLMHEDFETIGGIILSEFERMPRINEHIDLANWRFTILAADLRMISVIKVQDLRKNP